MRSRGRGAPWARRAARGGGRRARHGRRRAGRRSPPETPRPPLPSRVRGRRGGRPARTRGRAVECVADRGVVGVRGARRRFAPDRGGEHVRLVVDDGHVPSHVIDGEVAHVDAVDGVPTARVEVAGEHREQGALARPVGPMTAHSCPGVRRRSVGAALAVARSTRPRPVEVDPGPEVGMPAASAAAVSVTAGSWSRRASRRPLPCARARRASCRPAARGRHRRRPERERSAATGAPVRRGRRGRAAARVAAAVATKRVAATRRAAAALPAHAAAACRARRPAIRRPWRAADGLQLGRPARHEVADPQHLGRAPRAARRESATRARQASQQVAATATSRAGEDEADSGGEQAVRRTATRPADGARDQRHGDPHLRVDDVGEVVDDAGEHVGPRRRPSRAGVSGTSAAYTEVRRPARSSSAASCETQPLEVAQDRPGDAEGAHRDDRDQQGEDDRLLAGAHDEPAGRRRQRHAGGGGGAAEQPAEDGAGGSAGQQAVGERRVAAHATTSGAARGASGDVLVGERDAARRGG